MKTNDRPSCLFCVGEVLPLVTGTTTTTATFIVNEYGDTVTVKREQGENEDGGEVIGNDSGSGFILSDKSALEDLPIQDDLRSIFIVRKVLDLSEETCEQYLGRRKEGYPSPGSWFAVCGKCNEAVRECYQTYQHVKRLEGKLMRMKVNLKTLIRESNSNNGRKRKRRNGKHCLSLSDDIRKCALELLDGHVEATQILGDIDTSPARNLRKRKATVDSYKCVGFEETDPLSFDWDGDSGKWAIEPAGSGTKNGSIIEEEEEVSSRYAKNKRVRRRKKTALCNKLFITLDRNDNDGAGTADWNLSTNDKRVEGPPPKKIVRRAREKLRMNGFEGSPEFSCKMEEVTAAEEGTSNNICEIATKNLTTVAAESSGVDYFLDCEVNAPAPDLYYDNGMEYITSPASTHEDCESRDDADWRPPDNDMIDDEEAPPAKNRPTRGGHKKNSCEQPNGLDLAKLTRYKDGDTCLQKPDSGTDKFEKISLRPSHYKCEECPAVYYNCNSKQKEIQQHQELHKNNSGISCSECGLYCKERSLGNHLAWHHPEAWAIKRPTLRKQRRQTIRKRIRLPNPNRKPYTRKSQSNGNARKIEQLDGLQITDQNETANESVATKQGDSFVERTRTLLAVFQYKCEKCPAEYSAQHTYKNHEELHATNSGIPCHLCGWLCEKKRNLYYHLSQRHPRPWGKQPKKPNNPTHAPELPYYCDHCHMIYTTSNFLAKHYRLYHHNQPTVPCKTCSSEFLTKQLLQIHLEEVHGESISGDNSNATENQNHDCGHCSQRFSSKLKLDFHIADIHRDTLYQCRICDYQAIAFYELNEHIKKKHEIVKVICELCSKVLQQESLNAHMRIYHFKETGFKPVKCTFEGCPRMFESNAPLRLHILHFHKKVKEHCCEHCGKAFGRSTDLKRHILLHTAPKELHYKKGPFICEHCPAGTAIFNVRQGLYYHMKNKHSDKYLIRCKKCGKGYAQQSMLLQHEQDCKVGNGEGSSSIAPV